MFPKAALVSMILGKMPDPSIFAQADAMEPVKLRALRPPAAHQEAVLLKAPPDASILVRALRPPAAHQEAVLLKAPPDASTLVRALRPPAARQEAVLLKAPPDASTLVSALRPPAAHQEAVLLKAPPDAITLVDAENERAATETCCTTARNNLRSMPYAEVRSTGLGISNGRVRFLGGADPKSNASQLKDLSESLCLNSTLGCDGIEPGGVIWSHPAPDRALQHQDTRMRLEGVFDSAKMGSVVLGEGQLPEGDSKSLDHSQVLYIPWAE